MVGELSEQLALVVRALPERPEAWVDFMMRFELGLEEPDRSALQTVLVGGLAAAAAFGIARAIS